MMRPIRTVFVLFLALHTFTATALASLRDDVDRLVRAAALKGATVAVSIRDCAGGSSMVSINADAQMAPASNMKLLTSGAALHALGANYEFTTKLLRDGDRLMVVGDGDPAFGDPDLLAEMSIGGLKGIDVETFLNFWIKPVVEAGMKNVSEVVVDDRIFDREFIHPTWPDDQLNERYCAQVSGLNFHGNVLYFYPRPRPGQPPNISVSRPEASWLKLINNASSKDAPGEKTNLGIHRRQGTNEMTFRGNLRAGYKDRIAITMHDAPDFFARLLADRLRRDGVIVANHRVSQRNDPPSTGTPIGPAITTPISTVVTRCNTDSENLYAESLLKRIGYAMTGEPGSWVNGTAIVRHIVHERLDNPSVASGVVVIDGSGLSAENRVTASAMTAWLHSFANDEKLGPVFIESLAVAGKTGKLQKRYAQIKLYGALVQAKTGYINHVSCLSGFVTMPDGKRRAFSVLVNGLKDPTTVPLAKKLQDQIVSAIAEDMQPAPVTLGSD